MSLRANCVTFSYDGVHPVVRDVSAEVREGEFLGIRSSRPVKNVMFLTVYITDRDENRRANARIRRGYFDTTANRRLCFLDTGTP